MAYPEILRKTWKAGLPPCGDFDGPRRSWRRRSWLPCAARHFTDPIVLFLSRPQRHRFGEAWHLFDDMGRDHRALDDTVAYIS